MSLFVEIGLSVAFTLISLAPMVADWAKANNGPQTRINVLVGMPPLSPEQHPDKEKVYAAQSYGGCAPEISLFNPNGDRVGYYMNKDCKNRIHQNNPRDLMADYIKTGGTEVAEYITVAAAGIDAICISAIAVTFPASSDTYAFLPGEVAAICRNHNEKLEYYWSESETSVQFRNPDTGTTQMARPKCLWIDRPDNKGVRATRYQGFQVHLPDFKRDNSTFSLWQQNPYHMCDSLARFGPYDALTVMTCPQIFSPPPKAGESLPLREMSACLPDGLPANDGKVYPWPCDDIRLAYQDRYNIMRMYKDMCPLTEKYQWFQNCAESYDGTCFKKRRAVP
ncbi:hypothetical protein BKA66DRAFT_566479 [Pyrenochaeta sp. MPI-SDFR-AT-0127]|nr:hypothetical protein BKA66DRAFT_566479 [Pyrenochaeta sp. MPI-SDFR-AT-0127]